MESFKTIDSRGNDDGDEDVVYFEYEYGVWVFSWEFVVVRRLLKDVDQCWRVVARESRDGCGMRFGSEAAARRNILPKILMRKSVAPLIEVKGGRGVVSISHASWWSW